MLNIFNATNMYITSDNHFFHSRIIKYCDRNYNWESDEDILRMNEDMLKEFDKLPDTPKIENIIKFKSQLKSKYL